MARAAPNSARLWSRMPSRSAWASRLSSSRIGLAGAGAQAGTQIIEKLERIAVAHPGSTPLVDSRLQPPHLLLALLVAADEVADIVAGAAVAPLRHPLLRPALELVRDGNVH